MDDRVESDSIPPIAEAPTDPAPELTDSQKIDHILEMVRDLADGMVAVSQNITVLNGRLGVTEDDTISLSDRVRNIEEAVTVIRDQVNVLHDRAIEEASNTRESLHGTKESIRALEQAEQKRAAGNGR